MEAEAIATVTCKGHTAEIVCRDQYYARLYGSEQAVGVLFGDALERTRTMILTYTAISEGLGTDEGD